MEKYLKVVLLTCLYSFFFVVLYTSYSNRDWFFRTILNKLINESNFERHYNSLNHTTNELHASVITQVKRNISRIENVIQKDDQKTPTDKGRNTAPNSKCKPAVPRLSTKPLPVTGLVSFPGAGNTWTRHLLQQVSGIGTASVYCDNILRKRDFPFECHRRFNETIAVKTHYMNKGNLDLFDRVILLIRNPYTCILSHFNFVRGGQDHVGHARNQYFLNGAWKKFVQGQTVDWKNFNLQWMRNFSKPLYLLFYENLQTDLQNELERVFEFLKIQINETALRCIVENKEGNFHRRKKPIVGRHQKPLKLTDLYTEDLTKNINAASIEVSAVLKSKFGIQWTYTFPPN